MEIGAYTGILTAELAEAALRDDLETVWLEYKPAGEWEVWARHRAGDVRVLSDEGGWQSISFKSLREALVCLKTLGLSRVQVDLSEWAVNLDL